MTIPPELKQMIAQAKQQFPELAQLPDEQVVQLIMRAMQEQQAGPPAGEEHLERMSALELMQRGENLINTGMRDEAERYYFAALEKAEQAGDSDGQCICAIAAEIAAPCFDLSKSNPGQPK